MRDEPGVGCRLGGYRLEALIGRGTVGTVYEATQLRLERRVALKVVAPELTRDARYRERFLEQSHIAARLTHPSLVPVLEYGEDDGQLYLAMQLVAGEDLRRLLAHVGRLAPERAIALLAQVADALDAAHAAGVVHGDVKPENVLVGPSGDGGERAYLADLGLASRADAGTSPASGPLPTGTLDYVAPEAIGGRAIDRSADVYGLGCVLFECLAGTPPFHRPTEPAASRAHLAEAPPRLSELRPELTTRLDAVLEQALAPDPASRFTSAGALIAAAHAAFSRAHAAPVAAVAGRGVNAATLGAAFAAAAGRGILPDGAAVGMRFSAATAQPAAMSERAPDVPTAMPPPAPRAEPAAPARRGSRVALSAAAAVAVAAAAVAARWLFGWLAVEVPGAAPPADDTLCTVFAPSSAAPGATILVQAFVHCPEDTADARAIASELDVDAVRRAFRSLRAAIPSGSRLDFELRMPGLEVDEAVATLVFAGRTEAVQFGVHVPPDTPPGAVIGLLAVSLDGAPLGRVRFKLAIEAAASRGEPEPQGHDAHRYTFAFISYSSEDRDEVVARLQTLSITGVDYFHDVLSIPPGDRWKRAIEAGIDRCDLFLLFWSSHARESEWVRREVRRALARQATDDLALPEIRPIIVEGPPVAEPWDELAELQFNDPLLYLRSRRVPAPPTEPTAPAEP